MRAREFEKLSKKYILPHLPEFKGKGKLLYLHPLKPFIRGFCCQSSIYDRLRFTVWVFIMPAYIPKDVYTLNFGERLGTISGGPERWWQLDDKSEDEIMADVLRLMKKEGLPFLAGRSTPKKIARIYKKEAHHPHLKAMEMVAYAHVLFDDYRGAKKRLKKLTRSARGFLDESPYLQEMLDRAAKVQAVLEQNPQSAKDLLDSWSDETLKNLRLSG